MRDAEELAALAARRDAAQAIVAELEECEAEALEEAQFELRPRVRQVSKGVLDLHRPPTVAGRPPRVLQWQSNDPMLPDRQPVTVAQLLRWDPRANVARYTLASTRAAREIGALLPIGLEPTVIHTRNKRTGAIGVELVMDSPHTAAGA